MEPKLYEAAKSGDFGCVTKMSGYPHIDFNQTTPMGNNLLHVAVQHKQVDFIEQLLAQCPSSVEPLLFQRNHKGDTPLHIAAKVDSHRISKIFIDFAKTPVSDVEEGQVDRQKELLRMVNADKDNALHFAVRYGCSLVVKLLIEKDPELCNISNVANESPLSLAMTQEYSDITKEILDASPPSSSHKGFRGMTALHAALCHKSPLFEENLKIIVEKRPQMIRESDDIGWTPLHYAAGFGNVKAVKFFLRQDISTADLVDNDGESVLHIAAFSGHVNVIKKIIKLSPHTCEVINNRGQTALHTAVIGGRLRVVKFMLQTPGFNVLTNEQDKDGNTAMHLAVLHRQYKIIHFLAKDRRVDMRLSNKKHMTALDIFDSYSEIGFKARKVYRAMNANFGVQSLQDRAIKCVKKRLSVTSTCTMTNIMSEKERRNLSKPKTMVEVSLLVATLVATVTFAAAFTVPGGFNNGGPDEGAATFAGKAAFQAFVVFNTVSFLLSIVAVYLHFDSSFISDELRERAASVAGSFIGAAILGMVVAFACATYVVLPKEVGLQVLPFAMIGLLSMPSLISMLRRLFWKVRLQTPKGKKARPRK